MRHAHTIRGAVGRLHPFGLPSLTAYSEGETGVSGVRRGLVGVGSVVGRSCGLGSGLYAIHPSFSGVLGV